MKWRSLLALAVAGLLLPAASAQLRIPRPGSNKDKDKEKEKQQKVEERERKATAKNVERYEKLKTFTLDKYANDPDFREEVDEAYEELMRDHTQRAYEKNIHRNSYLRTVHEDTWRVHEHLYDNLLVQDHVNRKGQALVPPESEKAFAFKVIPDPTPLAETLSTGTIYVSTGLISMLESEAQLAYVLAHEMAHVHLDHWKERVMMQEGAEAYAEAQQKKARRIALLGTLAGAAVGGAAGGSVNSALAGAAIGGIGGAVAGYLLNRPLVVAWDKVQEDQADDLAFKAVLATKYDPREIPKLYLAIEKITSRDRRAALGFIGDRKRVKQRLEKVNDLIANAHKAEIEVQAKQGFISSTAEHRNLMAELKRDNGIMAYYHDMFEMARTNLSEATAIRDNDPAAHYFHGKVVKLIGRTDEDMRIARDSFYKATKADLRQQNFGSHLHLALMMSREKDFDRKAVADNFDTYVSNYARWNVERAMMATFPPNLDSIYEYMTMYGDSGWRPKVPDLKDLPTYQVLHTLALSELEKMDRRREPVRPEAPARQVQGGSTEALTPAAAVGAAAGAIAPGRTGQAVRTGTAVKKAVQQKK